ncbi:MAG: hypothetical protein NPIRA02_24860 [Nitrospirales bacterium]|nr:MAG: hypothetical protein NPIRA02_24860 [Nitrospirales bacterium]
MQTLDVHNPGLPDLQFVLMVLALSTSDLEMLTIPVPVRKTVFNRCWALLHETPPPEKNEDRRLDLRESDEVTLDAMVIVIRRTFEEHHITHIAWDHPPSEPTRTSTPEAQPLVDRLQNFNPVDPNSSAPEQN